MASEINDALRVISDLGKVLEKTAKEYKDSIGDVGRLYADTKRGANKRNEKAQEANYDALQKTTKSLDDLYKASTKWQSETKEYTKASADTTRELKRSAQALKAHGPANMTDELKDALDKVANTTNLTSKEIDHFQKVIANAIVQENKLAAIEKRKILRTKLVNEGLENLRKKTIGIGASFDRIKAGLAGSFDELEFAQAHQIGTYGILEQGMNSFSKEMGMVPASFQRFTNHNKSLILASGKDYATLREAMGQATHSFSRVNAQNQTMMQQAIALTGDEAKATNLMNSTLTTLSSLGQKLSFDELRAGSDGLMKDFQHLSQITNKSNEEIGAMTSSFLESSAAREKISMMQTKTQRVNYAKQVTAELKRNAALGLSLEQTFNILSKQADLGNATYVERLKSSAYAGQLAKLVGMSDKDSEFLRTRGTDPKNISEDDLPEFERLTTLFADKLRDARGGKDKGLEAGVDHLSTFIGAWKPLLAAAETRSSAGKALDKKQADAATSQASNLGTNTQHLADLKNAYDTKILPWIADPGVKLLAGSAGVIGDGFSSVLGGAVGGALGGVLSKGLMAGFTKAIPALLSGLGLGLSALTLGLAASAGVAIGYVLGPVVRWVVTAFDNIFGTDVWGLAVDKIGGGVAFLLDTLGVQSAADARQATAAAEAAEETKKSLAAVAKKLAPQKLYEKEKDRRDEKARNKTTASILPSTPLTDNARTSLKSSISKGRVSLKQLENQLPNNIDYTRLAELQNIGGSGAIKSDTELMSLATNLQEQNEVLREILAASKGTANAVVSSGNVAASFEKNKSDIKQQEMDDAAAESGHVRTNMFQAARS